jgi:hypothetical protein
MKTTMQFLGALFVQTIFSPAASHVCALAHRVAVFLLRSAVLPDRALCWRLNLDELVCNVYIHVPIFVQGVDQV